MDAKLTLRLNKDVIERAKSYAESQNISLSRLIEAYLDNVSRDSSGNERPTISPLVQSLIGVLDLPEDYDYKEDYKEHLRKKHS